jgi:alkylation response protein AidB-like acyl-CoA dehydrogenase
MQLRWSHADIAFRDEVRTFLDAELTPDLRDATRRMTSVYAPPSIAMEWQRRLHKRGWVVPSWPVEYGGCGWTQVQSYIFTHECAAADAPPLSPMGLGMCGPVLLGYGTTEQKAHYLPRMLSGDDFWCQGYSETESGSDLASLRMKAVRDGEEFVCDGHKIWTTHGHAANMIFCLVRTTQGERLQQGITFLLIDMTTPGVSVQPIVSLSGEHIQNLITFDAVRVPVVNVVGAIDNGWTVAKYLMEFERGGSLYAPGIQARLRRLRSHISSEGDAAPDLRHRIASIAVEIEVMDALELQFMMRLSAGGAPGTMASVLKVLGTELSQRLTEVELEAAGLYAAAWQPHLTVPGGPTPGFRPPQDGKGCGIPYAAKAAAKYFNDRAGSIYAGTNEIQRNIVWGTMQRR